MNSFNKKRWKHSKECCKLYISSGDCDPSYPVLKHLAQKYSLNKEDRYWLAILYSACYNDATAWAMFQTAPNYKEANEENLTRWWKAYKSRLIFTTDRLKVKSFNKLVPMLISYKKLLGSSQTEWFDKLLTPSPELTYKNAYKALRDVYYVGRFSLFLLTEIIHVLTGLPMAPDKLDLRLAESCRNGLCYAISKEEWVKKALADEQYTYLHNMLLKLLLESQEDYPNIDVTYWSLETFLCAYKKYFWKKRYIGYYIDRQQNGLQAMKENLPEIQWGLFWEARKSCLDNRYLGELHGWSGIRKEKMGLPDEFNYLLKEKA